MSPYTSNIIGITDLDTSIYRIYSKQRFIDLLKTGQNGLVNPALWEDPFENFFLNSTIIGPQGEHISMATLAADWYGQCWTYNDDTDAMWRIYSHEKDGIKVSTTVRKLFSSFYDSTDELASVKFFCGQVEYKTEKQISQLMAQLSFQDVSVGGSGATFAELLCMKREAFRHENEVRLLFQDTIPRRGVKRVATFTFDLHAICHDVILDPRLPDDEGTKLEKTLRAAGCHLPISKSPLYRVPKFQISLT